MKNANLLTGTILGLPMRLTWKSRRICTECNKEIGQAEGYRHIVGIGYVHCKCRPPEPKRVIPS